MLDASLKTQLQAYLERLTRPVHLVASLDDGAGSAEMLALLQDIEALSP
jgi:alkyl hydroperoxide reductase subunit F